MHRAPALLELGLGHIGQPTGLDVEPLIDLGLRGDVLVNVARLVAQVQHHAVFHRLVVLVGVDVRPEGFDTLLLVALEQRRPSEANHHGPRQQFLHCLVELTGLGAVALIYEDEDFALGVEILGQVAANVLDERIDVAFLCRAELVYQRSDQPLVAGVEHAHQVGTAPRAMDVLADALEDLLDLLVQFGAVGDE